jgi:hypothetical protein
MMEAILLAGATLAAAELALRLPLGRTRSECEIQAQTRRMR